MKIFITSLLSISSATGFGALAALAVPLVLELELVADYFLVYSCLMLLCRFSRAGSTYSIMTVSDASSSEHVYVESLAVSLRAFFVIFTCSCLVLAALGSVDLLLWVNLFVWGGLEIIVVISSDWMRASFRPWKAVLAGLSAKNPLLFLMIVGLWWLGGEVSLLTLAVCHVVSLLAVTFFIVASDARRFVGFLNRLFFVSSIRTDFFAFVGKFEMLVFDMHVFIQANMDYWVVYFFFDKKAAACYAIALKVSQALKLFGFVVERYLLQSLRLGAGLLAGLRFKQRAVFGALFLLLFLFPFLVLVYGDTLLEVFELNDFALAMYPASILMVGYILTIPMVFFRTALVMNASNRLLKNISILVLLSNFLCLALVALMKDINYMPVIFVFIVCANSFLYYFAWSKARA